MNYLIVIIGTVTIVNAENCMHVSDCLLTVCMPNFTLDCVDDNHICSCRPNGTVSRLPNTYRGAVYEHAVILPDNTFVTRAVAVDRMMKNLNVYQEQAKLASLQNVDILVFPEDGVYGMNLNRSTIKPYLEFIPDPKLEIWTPCDDPNRYPNTDIQRFLSCLAKNYSMYIVANIGDKQPCKATCPSDGQFQYNTNVVYDKNGTLVARYHKYNLFFEFQFDKPDVPDRIYFDTEFGRFGIFTCFDMIFKEPVIPLIEQCNVTNVVFPTAWMDVLPFFSAVEFHSAVAAGMEVNILAANIHRPIDQFHGSGIYTPNGALNFYYNSVQQDSGRLLVSDIDVIRKPYSRLRKTNITSTLYKSRTNNHNPGEFTSYVFHDLYNFIPLTDASGSMTVCQRELCCYLDYSKQNSSDLFAFGVLDQLHTHHGNYYLQICILLKCATSLESSCGTPIANSSTHFERIEISGSHTAEVHVYPEILLTDGGQLKLSNIGQWEFANNTLNVIAFDYPLVSAALIGRVYSRDN